MFSLPFEHSLAQRITETAHLPSGQTSHNPWNLHCPPHVVCPSPLLQSPLPCLGPSRGPPPSGLWSLEAGPRPAAAALCPGPGARLAQAALGMLRGGRGGRFASQALALGGGRAGARLQLELGRLELELPGVSLPLLPLRARQPKLAREPREAASQQPTRKALSGARSPVRGSLRGGASPAGTRASHWHCRGTSQTAR